MYDSCGCEVALRFCGIREDKHGLADAVVNVQISLVRIELHPGRPIQLRLVAGDDAQRLGVPLRGQRVNFDRRWVPLPCTGNSEIAVMTPGIDEQELVLLVHSNAVWC